MKCQILFSEKSKKNVTNLSSAELSQSVVKVKMNLVHPYVNTQTCPQTCLLQAVSPLFLSVLAGIL